MATDQLTTDAAVRTSRAVLDRLTAGYAPRDFAVRFWDGTARNPDPGQDARFTLVLKHPGSLRKMLWPPNGTAFSEAYVYDDFDIEGDIFAFFRLVRHLIQNRPGLLGRLRLAPKIFGLPAEDRPRTGHQPIRLKGKKHSLERDRQVIGYHYDLSNEFFGLWLDERMLYTCAYFNTPEDTLEQAQEQKLDYVCRKLRLKPGEKLLDIGCGWGGLVIHAAKNYGVEALGVTLSQAQVDRSNDLIRQAGLSDRCRVEYRDYREVNAREGFDKIACIGMVEHLGESMMPIYFKTAFAQLKPGGVFLNHGLTLRANTPYPKWTKFARQYVFPDGQLEPVRKTLWHAEDAGFEVRDVESLREHYVLTLGHWIKRREDRHDEVVKAASETTYRVFRLYLAGARVGMRNGVYNIHQTLLSKPKDGATGLPLRRADWYT